MPPLLGEYTSQIYNKNLISHAATLCEIYWSEYHHKFFADLGMKWSLLHILSFSFLPNCGVQ